jgi:hypothetical protein
VVVAGENDQLPVLFGAVVPNARLTSQPVEQAPRVNLNVTTAPGDQDMIALSVVCPLACTLSPATLGHVRGTSAAAAGAAETVRTDTTAMAVIHMTRHERKE